LWPLTLCAADWLERVGQQMPAELCAGTLAYAMAHGYSENNELAVDGADAERAIRKWMRGLKCTPRELIEAAEQIQAQDDQPEQPKIEAVEESATRAGLSRGDYSAFLAAATGESPEFWERRCSQDYTFAVLHQITQQRIAEGGGAIRNEAKIKAEIALGYAADKVRRRAKAEGA